MLAPADSAKVQVFAGSIDIWQFAGKYLMTVVEKL